MPVTSNFTIRSGYTNTTASDAGGSIVDTATGLNINADYKSGTGVRLVDKAFRKAVTAADAAADTLLLSALPGASGMAKCKKLVVAVTSATGSVRVTTGSTNGWSNGLGTGGSLTAQSSGTAATDAVNNNGGIGLAWVNGIVVAPGSNEQVTFTAVGAVSYVVHIEGSSA